MPVKKEVSRTIKGMLTDFHPMQLDELSFSHALNAIVEDFDGNGFPMIQNEPSNLLCTNFPSGFDVIGFVNIVEQSRIIWFLKNPTTGANEIGETLGLQNCRETASDGLVKTCDDCEAVKLAETTPLEKVTQSPCCSYHAIDNRTCFKFSKNFPINSVEYRITDCGIDIFFADDLNSRRWLQFEYTNDDVTQPLTIKKEFKAITGFANGDCKEPIYSTHIDCNKMSVQPNVTTPCIDFIDLVEGGSNKAGVYQFFIAFADQYGNKRTSYVSSTNPIPVRTKDITFSTDYPTDRAIALEVKNLDQYGPYQYYKLAVAKTINKFTSFYEVGTFPVTQDKIHYTGNEEAEIKLTEGDIFQRVPYYKSAGSVTASGKILFWASLKEFTKPNLQRIANNVKLQWQTIAIPEAVYRNPRNVNKFRGYMRDEVYPFGIVFIYENGEESPVYHIPGRASVPSDLEVVTGNDVIVESNCDDCAEEEESFQREEQVIIDEENLNVTECPCSDSGPTLVLDNSNQAVSCPLTPHSDTGCTPVTLIGTPPSVNAGVDQIINYLASAPLNGTVVAGSSPIISTLWTQLSGPKTVVINNAGTAVTYFSEYDAGTYTFQLCATDVNGNVVIDTVQYDVTVAPNVPPVANPGPDKLITLPVTISYLDGNLSTDEDGIAGYTWSFISGPVVPVISSPTLAYTTITGLTSAGTYVFELEVTDIRGCVSTAQTKVYVVDNPCDSVPCCAILSYPLNGSVTSSFETVTLDWSDVACADSYDVYLANNSMVFSLIGNTVNSSFVINGLLDPNTIYHWYVVPKNGVGEAVDCEDCYRSFVTPPETVVPNCDKQRWQVYNTGTIVGGDLEQYKDCEETCYQYGEFAYWESTERYPNNAEIWGTLCGKPIRHHKFPDSFITHIHDGENASQDYARNNIVYPIGVKVDQLSVYTALQNGITNGFIAAEDASRITGYRIVRGNRFRNKSIVAKGLLYDMNQYRRKKDGNYFDAQDIFFANYPYNDLRSNPFVTDDFDNYENHNTQKGADLPFVKSKRYTFHSPDTHFSEPTVGTKLKLETVEYGQSEGYFAKSTKQARQRFLSNTSYTIALTAGIVAALLQTEVQEEYRYSTTGLITSGMGVASGVFGPFLPFQTGPGAAWIPDSAIDTILYPGKAANINTANHVEMRTIRGRYKDWYNPVYLATKHPELLPLFPLMFLSRIANFVSRVVAEAKIILDLIESLTPFRDWTAQYHSVGKYNSFKSIGNSGNKIRRISASSYLKGENSQVNEPSEVTPGQYVSTKINNWHRESSLYLRYAGVDFPDAGVASSVQDQSRFTLEDGSVSCNFDKRAYKPISSYYASVKNSVPDQYGNIFNVEYLPTDSCIYTLSASPAATCRGVYGGDTFINRFGLKTKVPYFLADTFRLPDGTDFNFENYPNLGVPRHYYNSTLGVGSEIDDILDLLSIVTPEGAATFLGRPKSIRDCQTNKFFYQNGYIYLYHYGIPYFLVESDVNVDMRHGENLKEKAFYPAQTDLDFWLQMENVDIAEDNFYAYNSDYSKQNKETPFTIDGPNFDPNRDCRVEHPNRIIYATDSNWLTYKANDYFDFPMSKGKITSIEGIENETVLVRTINSTSVFKAFNLIPVDGDTVQVGTGGVFKNPPQEFAETTLGYVGSQHKAILHTEYGHIWADAKRGQVFNLASNASGLDEISKDGMKNWFKENLPFRLLRDFPTMPESHIDNAFAGLGLCMAFDKRYNRFLLTKRDYKLKDKSVQYNAETREFFRTVNNQPVVVKLGDKRYFKDASWTVSYNFFTKSWISYHSYKPDYYIDAVDFFGSGKNGLWLHNLTNASYQVFYGKLYPFIAEYVTKFEGPLRVLNSVEFDTEVRRYQNEYDYVVKSKMPGFNKAIVYNDMYNSGLLNLVKTDKNDLSSVGKYPVRNIDNWEVEVAIANYAWRFNQFYNLVRENAEIPKWIFDANNADKSLNGLALNYKKSDFDLSRIKGQWFKTRLMNDKTSAYKIISKFKVDNLIYSIK